VEAVEDVFRLGGWLFAASRRGHVTQVEHPAPFAG
jgi:hypothetical protein